MTKYLNVDKNCGTSTGCFYPDLYKDLNGVLRDNPNAWGNITKVILSDGTSVGFRQWSGDCSWTFGGVKNICGMMEVDINGFRNPNQLGVDTFLFIMTRDTIVPSGVALIPDSVSYSFASACNLSKTSTSGWGNGYSCTAWVIYNENMDYLHCTDLSWSGKKECD